MRETTLEGTERWLQKVDTPGSACREQRYGNGVFINTQRWDFMLHPGVDNFQFLAFFFFKLTFKSLLLVRPSTQETKAKCLGLKDKIQLSTF